MVATGATIGAAQLDSLFESAVFQRLQHADQVQAMDLADLNSAAWEMRISKEYQKLVCPVALTIFTNIIQCEMRLWL